MSEQENTRVVKTIMDNMNKQLLESDDQYFAPNVKIMTVGSKTEVSQKQNREFLRQLYKAFPDIHYTVRDIIAQGEKVAVTWTARGTHKGTFVTLSGQSLPASNRLVENRGCTIFEFRNNLIQREEIIWDQVSLLTQLGVMNPQLTEAHTNR
jgi:steroid delta-isomerase-like uncharacterized protein